MTQAWTRIGPMEGNKTVNASYYNTLSISCKTVRVGSKVHFFLMGCTRHEQSAQWIFLYCSTHTSKPTFWALKPKLVIGVKPKLSIMILFAILYNLQAT